MALHAALATAGEAVGISKHRKRITGAIRQPTAHEGSARDLGEGCGNSTVPGINVLGCMHSRMKRSTIEHNAAVWYSRCTVAGPPPISSRHRSNELHLIPRQERCTIGGWHSQEGTKSAAPGLKLKAEALGLRGISTPQPQSNQRTCPPVFLPLVSVSSSEACCPATPPQFPKSSSGSPRNTCLSLPSSGPVQHAVQVVVQNIMRDPNSAAPRRGRLRIRCVCDCD